MTLDELDAITDAIAPAIANAVRSATAGLRDRVSELEKRPTFDQAREMVAHAVREAVAAVPVPKDGVDGRDGADGAAGERGLPGEPGRDGADASPVSDEAIAGAVAKHLEMNPPAAGRDGVDGTDGEKGERGEPGQDADPPAPVTLIPLVNEAVGEWLKEHPPIVGRDGKDGRDGVDGKDGPHGQPGERGAAGADGLDGVGLAGALIDRDGQLVITLTNGETKALGPVVGRNGLDGKDGAQGAAGFGLDDFDVEQPNVRTMSLIFRRGEAVNRFDLALGGFVDRGVYKADEAYELGDTVTWGGQLWIAQGPTSEKPGGNDDWRLGARKGRDGKDGVPGKDGERGPQGLPGRDGR